MEDTDRMLAACEANGVILSVDHTRRFLPIWRYCKEQLVDKGEIGEVQYIISRLHGPRSMMCARACPVARRFESGCERSLVLLLQVAERNAQYRRDALVCQLEA